MKLFKTINVNIEWYTPCSGVPSRVLSSKSRSTSRIEISSQWEAPRTTYQRSFGDRSFAVAVAGPRTWNNLPDAIRDSSLLDCRDACDF